MKGQEITFHDNILVIYDLFPEIEVLSGNSALDLAFLPGCMSVVTSCLAVSYVLWHVIIFPKIFSVPTS